MRGLDVRAGIADLSQVDAIEVYDCFTATHYMAIDHLGLTAPGESWKAIEDGSITMRGRLPINPSGGGSTTTTVSLLVGV